MESSMGILQCVITSVLSFHGGIFSLSFIAFGQLFFFSPFCLTLQTGSTKHSWKVAVSLLRFWQYCSCVWTLWNSPLTSLLSSWFFQTSWQLWYCFWQVVPTDCNHSNPPGTVIIQTYQKRPAQTHNNSVFLGAFWLLSWETEGCGKHLCVLKVSLWPRSWKGQGLCAGFSLELLSTGV